MSAEILASPLSREVREFVRFFYEQAVRHEASVALLAFRGCHCIMHHHACMGTPDGYFFPGIVRRASGTARRVEACRTIWREMG